jgi:hypothetical protein
VSRKILRPRRGDFLYIIKEKWLSVQPLKYCTDDHGFPLRGKWFVPKGTKREILSLEYISDRNYTVISPVFGDAPSPLLNTIEVGFDLLTDEEAKPILLALSSAKFETVSDGEVAETKDYYFYNSRMAGTFGIRVECK